MCCRYGINAHLFHFLTFVKCGYLYDLYEIELAFSKQSFYSIKRALKTRVVHAYMSPGIESRTHSVILGLKASVITVRL